VVAVEPWLLESLSESNGGLVVAVEPWWLESLSGNSGALVAKEV